MSAVFAAPDDELSAFEVGFIRAVLQHRGLFSMPSESDFRSALAVLQRFDEECVGNPTRWAWEPDLSQDALGELRGKVFIMFQTTTPSAAQWHKAHAALFGPMLCEMCG